jgi:RHS repeat-associated protein
MRSLFTRALCASLAITFVLPPTPLLFAQDRGLGVPEEAAEQVEDLRGLDAIDVDPMTGGLVYAREDLAVGEGDLAFRLVRTYRPWAGDLMNMGTHWASALDVHLDVHASGARAAFVGEDGRRTFFDKGDDGVLRAVTGHPAVIERFEDGFRVTGLGDERVWRFDAQGWPKDRSGPKGLRVEYAFEGAGAERRLTHLQGPWGRLVVERDARGAMKGLVTPGGARLDYTRDAQGNLAALVRTDARGALRETYTYDPAGRLLGLGSAAQARVTYDVLGRVLALEGQGVEPVRLRYLTQAKDSTGVAGREVQVTRGGETWTLTSSPDGRRLERLSESGESTLTLLDARERPVRVSTGGDGKLREWTFEYDARGRLAVKTGPEGTTRFEYGARVTDRPTKLHLPDGRTVAFSYDLRGDLTEVVAPGGATTRYGYDDAGRLISTTDPRGRTTTFTLDERGFVTSHDETGVGRTLYQRDGDGLVVKVKRADGRVVDVARDALGRARRVSDALGTVTAIDYDARGNVTRYTDELGQAFQYGYDARGRLVSVDDAMGALARLEYDAAGQLAAFTDALGNQTKLERPDARTVIVTDPATGRRVLRHDALGQLVEETRGESTISYRHDDAGHLVERTSPAGKDSFTYDAAGRLTGLTGPDGGYVLGYDAAGRLSQLTDVNLGMKVEYGYSAAGDRTALKLPWGKVGYDYDAQGRVTGVTLPEGGKLQIDLHPDGRRKEVRYPNGVVTRFTYQRARLTEVVTVKGEQVLERRAYGYDANGRIAWTEDKDQRKTTYTHDARGRLTEQSGPDGVTRWTYDAAGNRVSETRGAAETRYQVAAGNRVVTRGGEAISYTANGAITERKSDAGTTRYTYDHDDKLVAVTTSDGATVRYGYAPNGARLWREEGGKKTSYLNDLADVVGEVDAQGQVVTNYVHGPGHDDLLAARHEGKSFFYHWDVVRSVTALTDDQGQVAARYSYDPFGVTTGAEGAAAAWNQFRYTSRPLDAKSGLYDYRARSYAPDLGRFTTPDPMGVLGGLNVYAYVDNDPTLFNDPYGLKPWYERLWEGTKDVASGVASWAGGITKADVIDGLKFAGRQTWAFTKGFGKGLYGAAVGLVNTVLHPIDTVNGIIYAVEHWDETKEALLAKWEEYKDAAVNDPEKFAEMTGVLTAEILVSVAGTKGLDKLAKANVVANSVRRVAGLSRVTASPITRVASRAGTAVANRFPRAAETLRRARVIERARRVELAGRAARPGNVVTRAGRRVVDFGRDVGRAGRLAVREPGAFVVTTGRGLTRAGRNLVVATGRGTWTATRRFGIPTVIVFNDAITDAIDRNATHEAAAGAVSAEARGFLDDAGRLSAEELAGRIDAVGRTYRDYRNRLLAGVHEEDKRLEAALAELNAGVERGEIPDNTIDARLEAMLSEYGRRRHNLMVDLYERNTDVEHGMFNPSPNRVLSFVDEIDLLKAARAKVTDPDARALLDARIADLEATMNHEHELFRAGEHDALIAGIAGAPRLPGEVLPAASAPTPEAAVEAEEPVLDSMDGLIDSSRTRDRYGESEDYRGGDGEEPVPPVRDRYGDGDGEK